MSDDLEKALESDEAFEALLKEAAESPEMRAAAEKAEEGPHVPEEILMDYIHDRLDDDETALVMDHFSVCTRCAKKLFRLQSELARQAPAPWWEAFERSLDNDESFLAFLTSPSAPIETEAERPAEAESSQLGVRLGTFLLRMTGQERPVELAGPHLMEEEVEGYLDDMLSDDRMESVMDHMAECDECARRVFAHGHVAAAAKIIRPDLPARPSLLLSLRDQLAPKLAKAASVALAFEQLTWELAQRLFAPPAVHFMGPSDEEPALEVSGPLVESGLCMAGETVSLDIRAQRPGYVWLFDHMTDGDSGQVHWLFPSGPHDDASLPTEGHKKNVSITIPGPPGRHVLLAVWTASEPIDYRQLDFGTQSDVDLATTVFLEMLKKLSVESWSVWKGEVVVRGD